MSSRDDNNVLDDINVSSIKTANLVFIVSDGSVSAIGNSAYDSVIDFH